MILSTEHLRSNAQDVPITEVEMWDFNNHILPLKVVLNMEIIVFQDQRGNVKLMKNKYGVAGTLLSNDVLLSEGWSFDPTTNSYRKPNHTIDLQQGPRHDLRAAMTGEPVLQLNTLLVCQEGHTEPIKAIATLEELRDFFNPEDFIIHDNYLN